MKIKFKDVVEVVGALMLGADALLGILYGCYMLISIILYCIAHIHETIFFIGTAVFSFLLASKIYTLIKLIKGDLDEDQEH